MQTIKSALLTLATVGAMTALASPASAYVLSNSNGGDGYVTTIPGGFDLFGANNGVGANTTTYTTVAPTNESLKFSWTYNTADCCGSKWDPAGYVIDGNYTQLSTDSTTPGLGSSGQVTLNLLAGDTYGFYVYSPDSILGRGDIAVSSVPLPASAQMFVAGLLMLAGVTYTRKKTFA